MIPQGVMVVKIALAVCEQKKCKSKVLYGEKKKKKACIYEVKKKKSRVQDSRLKLTINVGATVMKQERNKIIIILKNCSVYI